MLLHSLLLQVGSDYMFRVDEDTVVDATFKVLLHSEFYSKMLSIAVMLLQSLLVLLPLYVLMLHSRCLCTVSYI
jgi:hypothetical protein